MVARKRLPSSAWPRHDVKEGAMGLGGRKRQVEKALATNDEQADLERKIAAGNESVEGEKEK